MAGWLKGLVLSVNSCVKVGRIDELDFQGKNRPFSDNRLHTDAPFMHPHDLAGEAEANAAAFFLGGVKRDENLL